MTQKEAIFKEIHELTLEENEEDFINQPTINAINNTKRFIDALYINDIKFWYYSFFNI